MKSDPYKVFNLIKSNIEKEEFKGYDPYDILNSPLLNLNGKILNSIFIQIQKRLPINIRPLLGIKKEYNPKAIGLILNAYCQIYQLKPDEALLNSIKDLFDLLLSLKTEGYSGACWGYNFPWSNPQKSLKKYHPSIVVTSFISKGIFQYYNLTKDPKALAILRSSCDYILNDLPVTENEFGICFSYTDVIKDTCFNASMLGAEILTKVYSLTGENELLNYATKAVDFTIHYQYADGRWDYAIDLINNINDKQLDFHQGFILESLYEFIKYSKTSNDKYKKSLGKGAEFYSKFQFDKDGSSYWRLPGKYPIDIHNQAQGIITLSLLKKYDNHYLEQAENILNWTIDNMLSQDGYFYYRINRSIKNKNNYIRWGQAWMLLALTIFMINNNKA